MTPPQAIHEIRKHALAIGQEITAIHPLVPRLQHDGTQSEILRALFELTKQVEVLKKQLLKLEKSDESKAL